MSKSLFIMIVAVLVGLIIAVNLNEWAHEKKMEFMGKCHFYGHSDQECVSIWESGKWHHALSQWQTDWESRFGK